MKRKNKRIVIIFLVMAIPVCTLYLVWQFLIPYDILVSVRTQGWLFSSYDTYYEINSQWGITKKTNALPADKYILTAEAYQYGNYSEWEKNTDTTDYSYIKQYDPLMDYEGLHFDVANIYGYIYYCRTDDTENYYRFSEETREIKQIPLDTIDKMILGSNDFVSNNIVGSIEKLGYFDYYQGLNDVMVQNISLGDIERPNLSLDYVSFLFNVVEINGRVFFNSGNRLFEFYPETKTAKYITSVRGNPKYFGRFSVIGVSGR